MWIASVSSGSASAAVPAALSHYLELKCTAAVAWRGEFRIYDAQYLDWNGAKRLRTAENIDMNCFREPIDRKALSRSFPF